MGILDCSTKVKSDDDLSRVSDELRPDPRELKELEVLLAKYAREDWTSVCRNRLDYLPQEDLSVEITKFDQGGPAPDEQHFSYHLRGDAAGTKITLKVPHGEVSKVVDIGQTLIFEIGNVMRSHKRKQVTDRVSSGLIGPMAFGKMIADDEPSRSAARSLT